MYLSTEGKGRLQQKTRKNTALHHKYSL